MHDTTLAVRALYERFPYPAGPHTLRLGFDVRRTLAVASMDRVGGGPLQVLDAGCSRGVGLIGAAQSQPDVRFTGIDVNRVALREAREEADRRGLKNVALAEVDLETLHGLQVPEGGFDVIVSSGVLHHLVDPAAGLALLANALAPHGVMDIMVYAKSGRVGLERVAREIERRVPAGELTRRLADARALATSLAPNDPDWAEAAGMVDVEFVDRYLHPSYISYDLDSLWDFLGRGGLQQIGWVDALAWLPRNIPGATTVPAALQPQARLVEPHTRPRMYMVYASKAGNPARTAPTMQTVEALGWALNPEGTLSSGMRHFWTGPVAGGFTWQHPSRQPLSLNRGPAELACRFLQSLGRPFRGHELVAHLRRHGVPVDQARKLLLVFHNEQIVWCPHESDLRAALPARLHGYSMAG